MYVQIMIMHICKYVYAYLQTIIMHDKLKELHIQACGFALQTYGDICTYIWFLVSIHVEAYGYT